MTIRCIAFDLDDTLWACKPVIEKAEQKFYQWLNDYYPDISRQYSFNALLNSRMSYLAEHPDDCHDLTQTRKDWLAGLAIEAGYSSDMAEEGFQVFWLARNDVQFFDGTLEVLERLAERFSLGVISNGNADIEHIGYGHLFDFSVHAEHAGVAKPHEDIFLQALKVSGVEAHEMVYVGDDPLRDVLGANSVGLHTAWFNPRLTPWPGGKNPSIVIQKLEDLEEKLSLFC